MLSGCPKSAAEPVSSLLRRHLKFPPPPPAKQVPNNPIPTQKPSAPACMHGCGARAPYKGPISFPNLNVIPVSPPQCCVLHHETLFLCLLTRHNLCRTQGERRMWSTMFKITKTLKMAKARRWGFFPSPPLSGRLTKFSPGRTTDSVLSLQHVVLVIFGSPTV